MDECDTCSSSHNRLTCKFPLPSQNERLQFELHSWWPSIVYPSLFRIHILQSVLLYCKQIGSNLRFASHWPINTINIDGCHIRTRLVIRGNSVLATLLRFVVPWRKEKRDERELKPYHRKHLIFTTINLWLVSANLPSPSCILIVIKMSIQWEFFLSLSLSSAIFSAISLYSLSICPIFVLSLPLFLALFCLL